MLEDFLFLIESRQEAQYEAEQDARYDPYGYDYPDDPDDSDEEDDSDETFTEDDQGNWHKLPSEPESDEYIGIGTFSANPLS